MNSYDEMFKKVMVRIFHNLTSYVPRNTEKLKLILSWERFQMIWKAGGRDQESFSNNSYQEFSSLCISFFQEMRARKHGRNSYISHEESAWQYMVNSRQKHQR